MEYKYRITVFTPTYNRAYIISNLYNSLLRQTYKNFEWLIVDDGSVDETESLVTNWIKTSDFAIRYYKTQNGGKHRAINKGMELADGEIFFTMDSDDELTFDALEKVNQWFCDIKDCKELKGIVANRGFTKENTINPFFSSEYMDMLLSDMGTYEENGKKVLGGERAIVFYTDFCKKYPFPEFEGENFMTEAVVYNRMSRDGHKLRFYNDIIWIFEYREDGLTRSGTSIFLKNPYGYGLWVREKMDIEKWSLKRRLMAYYTFTADLATQKSAKDISRYINAPFLIIYFMKRFNLLKRKLRGKK